MGPAIPDKDARVSMEARSLLVEATPMLDWTVGGVEGGAAAPKVSMTHAQMVRCFTSRCCVGPTPADIAAAAGRSVLTAYLKGPAWKRILTELCDSGLLDGLVGATTLKQLWTAIDELFIGNPANLELSAGDWEVMEPFDLAASPGRAAVPATRGVAAIPAVPAVAADPGPPVLAFLNLADLTLLEDKGQHRPMEAWAQLAGMVGPCATRDARARALSSSNVVARMLASAMTAKFGELDNAGRAINLADYIRGAALPSVLAARTITEAELRAEARDSFAYHRSEQGKREVETARLSHLADRCSPTPHPHARPQLVGAPSERALSEHALSEQALREHIL